MSISNIKSKKDTHWFTAADALIVIIVVGLLVTSAVLFLFPKEEEKSAVAVKATIAVYVEEELSGIKENDTLFFGEDAIGVVQKIDKLSNYVIASIDVEKDDGVYVLDDTPIRINGTFTLETRLCRYTGTVIDIGDREE